MKMFFGYKFLATEWKDIVDSCTEKQQGPKLGPFLPKQSDVQVLAPRTQSIGTLSNIGNMMCPRANTHMLVHLAILVALPYQRRH